MRAKGLKKLFRGPVKVTNGDLELTKGNSLENGEKGDNGMAWQFPQYCLFSGKSHEKPMTAWPFFGTKMANQTQHHHAS